MKNVVFFLLLLASCCACERKLTSSIPNAPVYLELNLTTDYNILKTPYKLLFFEEKDNNTKGFSFGYGGLIVFSHYNSQNGIQISAFDMSCPYEIKKDVLVRPIKNNFSVRCEKCGSTFDLAYGLGQVEKGPAKEALKRYRCLLRPEYLGYEILYIRP